MTTSGASTDDAIAPDGTRKCAQTTSGLAAARTLRRSSRNRFFPPIRAALAVHCTVGEVCGTLREEWGSYL